MAEGACTRGLRLCRLEPLPWHLSPSSQAAYFYPSPSPRTSAETCNRLNHPVCLPARPAGSPSTARTPGPEGEGRPRPGGSGEPQFLLAGLLKSDATSPRVFDVPGSNFGRRERQRPFGSAHGQWDDFFNLGPVETLKIRTGRTSMCSGTTRKPHAVCLSTGTFPQVSCASHLTKPQKRHKEGRPRREHAGGTSHSLA